MSEMGGAVRLAGRLAELAARVQEGAAGVDFMFGRVLQAQPLSVQVEQKLVLPEEMLILSGAVVELEERVDEETGDVYYVPVHTLLAGENVLLARMSGGAAYVVLNRCYGM